jgi:hypothetical protein
MTKSSKKNQRLLLEIEELKAKLDVAQQRLQKANELMPAKMTGSKRKEEAFEGLREGLEEGLKTPQADQARANKQPVGPEENLKARLRFERLLSEISARFINLPADRIDSEIEEAQRHICKLLDIERSTLLQVTDGEPESLLLTHIHQPPEYLSPPKRMSARDFFPWMSRKVLGGETVTISRMTDLPP